MPVADRDQATVHDPQPVRRDTGPSASSGTSFWITRHIVDDETPKSGRYCRMVRFAR